MTDGLENRVLASQTVDSQAGGVLSGESLDTQTDASIDAMSSGAKVNADQRWRLPRIVAIVSGLILMLCLVVGGVFALQSRDPYVQNVLAMTGNVERGHDIFQLNCATCHGLEALGEVGPDLSNISARRSRTSLIEQVISGQTPPMPQFQPSEKDMADLLAFLETL